MGQEIGKRSNDAYLEPISAHDAKFAVEQILLEMDTNDAVGAAERVLAGYTGPTLVK